MAAPSDRRPAVPRRRRPLPAWLLDAERVDVAVYAAIAATPTPSLDRAMRELTRAADHSRISIAAAGLLAATRGGRGARAAASGLAAVGVTSAAVNLVAKPLGRRHRPDPEALEVPVARLARMPLHPSFPSGHTASAFAFATGVGHVLPREALPLHALAALVGYSRVHTGVHFPGDVVAGSVIGSALGGITAHALVRTRPDEARDPAWLRRFLRIRRTGGRRGAAGVGSGLRLRRNPR